MSVAKLNWRPCSVEFLAPVPGQGNVEFGRQRLSGPGLITAETTGRHSLPASFETEITSTRMTFDQGRKVAVRRSSPEIALGGRTGTIA